MGTQPRRPLTGPSHDLGTVDIVTEGRILGDHYRLVREIARGGMGIVYEAEDVKLEGRRVAVKILPPELSKDEAAILRLKREASAVAALDHPNVVRLVEFNADAACHYLVMEYLDGDNLAVHLAREGRLPLDEVLRVVREVGGALAFAHRQNVLHRDVKPSNIVFKTVGDEHVAKLTDFGIAYQVRDSMTRLTGQESAGTLTYLAPEQLRGKRPSPASDLYSFAATVYELLVGEPPFSGAALSQQILDGTPEPVPDVPEHVNVALMRGLAKEPTDRHPDVESFVAALAAGVELPAVVRAPSEVPTPMAPPMPEAVATAPVAATAQPGVPAIPSRPSIALLLAVGVGLGILSGGVASLEGAPLDAIVMLVVSTMLVALFSWCLSPPLRRRPLSLALPLLVGATGLVSWPLLIEGFRLNLIAGLLVACVALASMAAALVERMAPGARGWVSALFTMPLTLGATLAWMALSPASATLRMGELPSISLLILAACVPFVLPRPSCS